jgi:hypothetical protein
MTAKPVLDPTANASSIAFTGSLTNTKGKGGV